MFQTTRKKNLVRLSICASLKTDKLEGMTRLLSKRLALQKSRRASLSYKAQGIMFPSHHFLTFCYLRRVYNSRCKGPITPTESVCVFLFISM